MSNIKAISLAALGLMLLMGTTAADETQILAGNWQCGTAQNSRTGYQCDVISFSASVRWYAQGLSVTEQTGPDRVGHYRAGVDRSPGGEVFVEQFPTRGGRDRLDRQHPQQAR